MPANNGDRMLNDLLQIDLGRKMTHLFSDAGLHTQKAGIELFAALSCVWIVSQDLDGGLQEGCFQHWRVGEISLLNVAFSCGNHTAVGVAFIACASMRSRGQFPKPDAGVRVLRQLLTSDEFFCHHSNRADVSDVVLEIKFGDA